MMNNNNSNEPLKSPIKGMIIGFVTAGLIFISLIILVIFRLEGNPPSLQVNLPSEYISSSQDLSFTVADLGSGIHQVKASITQNSREIVLLDKTYHPQGIEGYIRGGYTREDTIAFTIEPKSGKLTDGKALLKLTVQDFSWRKNTASIEKEFTIDTRAPDILVLSQNHNIRPGGSGVVVYRLSESCPENGVYVGDSFFPGYSGYFEDTAIHLAFFALNYDRAAETKMYVHAVDPAGNISRRGFTYYIGKHNFRKDALTISDRFIETKLVEFYDRLQQSGYQSPIDKFLFINRDMRKENDAAIFDITTKHSDSVQYWKGEFIQFPNSKRMASFGDHREYQYQGNVIDHQVHLGIDLASVAQAPIPASNTGKVVFADFIGIYGNSVILDHGYGLFSLYSHLSSIQVQPGQRVEKNETIGNTGTTGLAGGDHLHFSMIVHHTFVDPIEWWDDHWIKDNITQKLSLFKLAQSE